MLFTYFKRRRRARLQKQTIPASWTQTLRDNVRYYNVLPSPDRDELHAHMHVFLAEKQFEGCGGLQLTEEIRLTIAAHACTLLLHRQTDYYPHLTSILVYPDAFIVPTHQADGYLVHEGKEEHLGESWREGTVILAWNEVKAATNNTDETLNVALHEFAHQIDEEDGIADGTPPLKSRRRYDAWHKVFVKEFSRLRQKSARGRATFIDDYAATDEAEFFAVVTELFFETPVELRARHPGLYDELKGFYRQDPAELFKSADAPRRNK